VRYFDGRPYLLERAITTGFAFIRGHRADRMGNLQFRGGSRNFNVSFAKAARVTIAEVDEITETGEIPPGEVDLPGVFVSRVVLATTQMDVQNLPMRVSQPASSARSYRDPVLKYAAIASSDALAGPPAGAATDRCTCVCTSMAATLATSSTPAAGGSPGIGSTHAPGTHAPGATPPGPGAPPARKTGGTHNPWPAKLRAPATPGSQGPRRPETCGAGVPGA